MRIRLNPVDCRHLQVVSLQDIPEDYPLVFLTGLPDSKGDIAKPAVGRWLAPVTADDVAVMQCEIFYLSRDRWVFLTVSERVLVSIAILLNRSNCRQAMVWWLQSTHIPDWR